MKKLTLILSVLAVVFIFFTASTAFSFELRLSQNKLSEKSPEELIEGGVKMIIDALDILLKTIPQYEAPEIQENGDIIIRRSKPSPKLKDKTSDQEKTYLKSSTYCIIVLFRNFRNFYIGLERKHVGVNRFTYNS